MSKSRRIQDRVKKAHLRLTEARKALIEILIHRHLTFKEIYQELSLLGHTNLATLYNNIESFIDAGIIVELSIDGTKYYDIVVENNEHDANNHLHIVQMNKKNQPEITEINDPEIFSQISKHVAFNDYDIKSMKILVTVNKKTIH